MLKVRLGSDAQACCLENVIFLSNFEHAICKELLLQNIFYSDGTYFGNFLSRSHISL